MQGGEIFIPKVPAMKMTDLFELLAPTAKVKVVGIRPGEKLHEVLVTKEEARHAYDVGDFYVIIPEAANQDDAKRMEKYSKKHSLLPHNFHFASDENSAHMTKDQLLAIVERTIPRIQ